MNTLRIGGAEAEPGDFYRPICTGTAACLLGSPTCADHTGILIVVAVVPYPASVGTALQRVLPAGAAHFIHQDGARACPKAASARGTQRVAAA